VHSAQRLPAAILGSGNGLLPFIQEGLWGQDTLVRTGGQVPEAHACHPSFPAMGEAEIRRIMIPWQPGGEVFMTPHLNGKKLGVMVHTCHPS
jgi:hypothetical protein